MFTVSVVIPAYNASITLPETLKSVSGQTLKDIEVLVVDDGSTDDTAALAQSFGSMIPNLKVIRKSNGGVSTARNAGIALATGRFVASLDADDLWHPTYLEKLTGALEAAPSATMAYAGFRHLDLNGFLQKNSDFPDARGFIFHRMLAFNLVGHGSGIVAPREMFSKVGGYDEHLQRVADYDMQLKLTWAGEAVVVPEYLVGYLHHPASLSRNKRVLKNETLALLRGVEKAFPDADVKVVHRAFARRLNGAVRLAMKRGDILTVARLAPKLLQVGLDVRRGRLLAPNKPRTANPQHFYTLDPHVPTDVVEKRAAHAFEYDLATRADAAEATRRGLDA